MGAPRLHGGSTTILSVQPHPVMTIPLRHVGQDHFVTGLQAADDFDGAHRTASQSLTGNTNRRTAVFRSILKSPTMLSDCPCTGRPMHKARFRDAELDGPIHVQVRPRASRQRCVQCNIHSDGAIFYRRVNADDMAWNHTVSRVNLRRLVQLHILGLGLNDFDCGL